MPQQNSLINSNFSVWQRGTSLAVTSTSTSFYGADRWQIYSGSTGRTVSRQATGDTTNLPNIQYSMRVQRDSGNTNTAAILPAYSMETADAIKFAGQPVVFTFYARRLHLERFDLARHISLRASEQRPLRGYGPWISRKE